MRQLDYFKHGIHPIHFQPILGKQWSKKKATIQENVVRGLCLMNLFWESELWFDGCTFGKKCIIYHFRLWIIKSKYPRRIKIPSKKPLKWGELWGVVFDKINKIMGVKTSI